MGSEYYSSSVCWCNQQKLNLEAGIKLAEAIQDKEEREKVLEALSNIPDDTNYYSREGEVTKLGPVSMLTAAYQGYGDPEECNSLIGQIGQLLKHSEIMEVVGLSDDPDELITKCMREAFLRGIIAVKELGLEELSDAAAESLSKHKGYLNLSRLTELSDAAAESLFRYQGDLCLIGLTELNDAAAESLSKHQGLLDLGITELSDAAAESLSKHQGWLRLERLTELSDAAAESFSKHQGDLTLEGITELSDAAAESLSKHQGDLCLFGLTELSDKARKLLSANPDIELPDEESSE